MAITSLVSQCLMIIYETHTSVLQRNTLKYSLKNTKPYDSHSINYDYIKSFGVNSSNGL